MGRSQTIHCLGHAPIEGREYRIFPAMNRLEITQQRYKAEKEGLKIVFWTAQTKTGERILGMKPEHLGRILDSEIPGIKTIVCPICHGEGHNGKYFCTICNGSGITKPGHEKRWQKWQLDQMRMDRLAEKGN